MKQKEILVMTSFGPVPFDAVKDYIPKEVAKAIEENKEAIIKKMEEAVPMNLGYYVAKLAEKHNWKVEKMSGYLNTLSTLNLSALFSILLREVAIELDKKYEDHIDKSEKIFIVSLLDGRVHEACRGHIKNFRNFAAFRTIDDAKTACRITREILKDMFKSGKK